MSIFAATVLGSSLVVALLVTVQAARASSAPASAPMLTAGLIWPLSGSSAPDTSISSPFGPRWQASQSKYDYHPGLDIATALNTPVHAITDGVVVQVGSPTYESGLMVVVSHAVLGLYSAYLHLNATAMTVGEVVTQGQVIGLSGDSGLTHFSHLHFEIRLTASDYPTSTRNPMGYLPRPDVTTPTLAIQSVLADPIYSPTVSLLITASRAELDVNQIRVTLRDRVTGQLLDERLVDFNLRANTGADTLNQNGIQLVPAHFNTVTVSYALGAIFSALNGRDSFTLTAQVDDLAGHYAVVTTTVDDTTPPGNVTSLVAHPRGDGGADLAWIAPGDSGDVGRATTYTVRCAGAPINNFTWDSATNLPNPPLPLSGTLAQSWSVPGPFPSPVYFALKTADIEGNVSLLSNSALAEWSLFLPAVLK